MLMRRHFPLLACVAFCCATEAFSNIAAAALRMYSGLAPCGPLQPSPLHRQLSSVAWLPPANQTQLVLQHYRCQSVKGKTSPVVDR